MKTYLLTTYTPELPPDLSIIKNHTIENIADMMSRAPVATIVEAKPETAIYMRRELRGVSENPVEDWMWCEQIGELSEIYALDETDYHHKFAEAAARELVYRPLIGDVVRDAHMMHDPIRTIITPSWTIDPENGSAMRHTYLHVHPGVITISDPQIGDEHSAQVAAERIRHAGMTGVNLVRAVSKIARLSPMGEPLARILGVTIDPCIV